MSKYLEQYWLAILLSLFAVSSPLIFMHWGVHITVMALAIAAWILLTRKSVVIDAPVTKLTTEVVLPQQALNKSVGNIEHQVEIIQSDVNQVKAMMRDAIVLLHSSFTNIQKQASLQNSNLDKVSDRIQPGNMPEGEGQLSDIGLTHEVDMANKFLLDQLAAINVSSCEIEQNSRDAICALQFEDMATQLLDHINIEAGYINDGILHLRQMLEECDAGITVTKGSEQAATRTRVSSEDCTSTATGKKSVSQESMVSGDIELF